MNRPLRNAVLTVALGIAAGFGGMWAGHQFFATPTKDLSLHAMVHRDLKLTDAQNRELDTVERDYTARRTALEAEMRQANAELAVAIKTSDTAGPEVAAAVHHFHEAMGALQTETIDHVFAMRRVLTPSQRAEFDKNIEQALTRDAK